MARPGLIEHRKFRRFCTLLGVPEAHALGLLEFVWRVAYETASPYLGDSVDVEAAARWTGEQGRCCMALASAGGDGRPGFIEPVEGHPGHWQVHDLLDHAPDYVRRRLKREGERKNAATTGPARIIEPTNVTAESPERPDAGPVGDQSVTGHQRVTNRSQSGSSTEQCRAVQSSRKSMCTEAVLVFPCRTGRKTRSNEWPLTQELVSELEQAYPDMDVVAEARKAKVWAEANPGRRKTHDGMPRFLASWFARANDDGRYVRRVVDGSRRFGGGNGSKPPVQPDLFRGRPLGERSKSGKLEWTLRGWQPAEGASDGPEDAA